MCFNDLNKLAQLEFKLIYIPWVTMGSIADIMYSFILKIKLYDLKTEVNQNKVKLRIKWTIE